MPKSRIAALLVFLAAATGLAGTATAQSAPSAPAPGTASPKSDGKILGCPLGPVQYGYNKQCSMVGR
jgi:hypothetical protein